MRCKQEAVKTNALFSQFTAVFQPPGALMSYSIIGSDNVAL